MKDRDGDGVPDHLDECRMYLDCRVQRMSDTDGDGILTHRRLSDVPGLQSSTDVRY